MLVVPDFKELCVLNIIKCVKNTHGPQMIPPTDSVILTFTHFFI